MTVRLWQRIVARRRAWLLSVGALSLVTLALLAVRGSLDKTHVALAYLLVVLGTSSRGGRLIGVTMSAAAFLLFNFFFIAPYHTFVVAHGLDWAVLGAFLVTSLVSAQLLTRARSEAASAGARASEIERLSQLGAESLNAGRAEEALFAIATVIRSTLDAAACEVFIRDTSGGVSMVATTGEAPTLPTARPLGQPSAERLVEWVVENGRSAVELSDGSKRVASGDDPQGRDPALFGADVRKLVLPLRVRNRTLGVLTVVARQALSLDAAQQQFVEALSYYAALGVERLRLGREAEHAEALRKADEFKNALLASVSHDLRTPLTTIKALANEIRRDGDARAVTIEEEADRLNRFVSDLLDLSRIAGGALTVTPEVNAAEDLVGAALQRVSGRVGDRTLTASLDLSEPLLVGRFDFVHSLRILANLIENALKFAPSGSTVEVRARRAGGVLEFVVSDRGPGIPENEREIVFEPFYQGADTTPDAVGAGLGLSIARSLAAAQGGSIRYEPRAGGGSEFVFSVPAADLAEIERDTGSL